MAPWGLSTPPFLLPLPEQSLPSCKPDPVTWLAAWGYSGPCLRAPRAHVSTQGQHLCTEQSHFRQCNRLLRGLEQLLLDRADCVVNVQQPSRQSQAGCNSGPANLVRHRHLSLQALRRNALLLSAPNVFVDYAPRLCICMYKPQYDTKYYNGAN